MLSVHRKLAHRAREITNFTLKYCKYRFYPFFEKKGGGGGGLL